MKRVLTFEDIFPILRKGEIEELRCLFSDKENVIDEKVIEAVLSRADECDPAAIDSFLKHVIFAGEDLDYYKLYNMLESTEVKIENVEIKRVLQENSIYAYSYLVANEETEEAYLQLKGMLEKYMKNVSSVENRAFTIYEVITLLSGCDVRYLKDILFSFDRYIPYTESFSSLIFGDLGMNFYYMWEEDEDPEHKELAVVLLQKAIFSAKELFKLGKTEDFPLQLSNYFAYMSKLIPILEDEMRDTGSVEVKEQKAKEITDMVCFGIDLLVEFWEDTEPDALSEFFTSMDDALLISESTKDNFVSMMKAFFETDLCPDIDVIFRDGNSHEKAEDYQDEYDMEDILEDALKVREVLCDRR